MTVQAHLHQNFSTSLVFDVWVFSRDGHHLWQPSSDHRWGADRALKLKQEQILQVTSLCHDSDGLDLFTVEHMDFSLFHLDFLNYSSNFRLDLLHWKHNFLECNSQQNQHLSRSSCDWQEAHSLEVWERRHVVQLEHFWMWQIQSWQKSLKYWNDTLRPIYLA